MAIRHNCTKENDFEYVEVPIFEHQFAIIKCKVCGMEYKEIK